MKYPRGSEWRKWDLHVHTKFTAKNDQFTSLDFDSFCVQLFKKALKKEICTIGITDYFSIENYKKVKEYVSKIGTNTNFTEGEREKIKQIFILPNVELRMIPSTDSGKLVNIHCIFNPAYEDSLDNDFFGSIEMPLFPGDSYKMNKQGITNLGKKLDPTLTDENDQYKKGVESFVVSIESLQELCIKTKFKENTIIVVV